MINACPSAVVVAVLDHTGFQGSWYSVPRSLSLKGIRLEASILRVALCGPTFKYGYCAAKAAPGRMPSSDSPTIMRRPVILDAVSNICFEASQAGHFAGPGRVLISTFRIGNADQH